MSPRAADGRAALASLSGLLSRGPAAGGPGSRGASRTFPCSGGPRRSSSRDGTSTLKTRALTDTSPKEVTWRRRRRVPTLHSLDRRSMVATLVERGDTRAKAHHQRRLCASPVVRRVFVVGCPTYFPVPIDLFGGAGVRPATARPEARPHIDTAPTEAGHSLLFAPCIDRV